MSHEESKTKVKEPMFIRSRGLIFNKSQLSHAFKVSSNPKTIEIHFRNSSITRSSETEAERDRMFEELVELLEEKTDE